MDMKALQALMAKKGADKEIDPNYKKTKMDVLKQLHDEMTKMIGGDLGGLKKVTVASDNDKGLKQGLDKAKEMLAGGGEAVDHMSNEDDGSVDEDAANHEHVADDAQSSDDGDDMGLDQLEDSLKDNNSDDEPNSEDSVEDLDAEIERLKQLKAKKMMG